MTDDSRDHRDFRETSCSLPLRGASLRRRTFLGGIIVAPFSAFLADAATHPQSVSAATTPARDAISVDFEEDATSAIVDGAAVPITSAIQTSAGSGFAPGTTGFELPPLGNGVNCLARQSASFEGGDTEAQRWPYGWINHNLSAEKRIVSVSSDALDLDLNLASGTNDAYDYGGLRSRKALGETDYVLDLIIEARSTPPESLRVWASWFNEEAEPADRVAGMIPLGRLLESGPTRFRARLANPAGPSQLVISFGDTSAPTESMGTLKVRIHPPRVYRINLLPSIAEHAPGSLPSGWQWHSLRVPKSVEESTDGELRLVFGDGSTSVTDLGGIRTSTPINCGTAPAVVTADVGIDSPHPEKYTVFVAWFDGATGSVQGWTRLYNTQQGDGLGATALLPPVPDPHRLMVAVRASDAASAAATPVITLWSLALQPSHEVTHDLAVIPAASGATRVEEAALDLAPGFWRLCARLEDGLWHFANADLSERTAVSLGNVFGRGRNFTALQAIRDGGSGAAVLPALSWQSASRLPQATPTALSRVANRSLWLAAAPNDWSLAVGAHHAGAFRFELRDGDVAAGDDPSQQIRAEAWPGISVPFETDVWMSWAFRTTALLTGAFMIVGQWHYTSDPGDTSKYSPDLAFVLHPTSAGENRLRVVTRSDSGTPSYTEGNHPPGDEYSETNSEAETPIQPNTWYRIVCHCRFSRTGGGYRQWWLDGEEITNATNRDVPVGYSRIHGPRFQIGAYTAPPLNETFAIEYTDVEAGIQDLSDRIHHPLGSAR